MMFRRSFAFRLIGFVLVLALLAAGGSLLFRSGYTQGYLAGSLAAGAEGGAQLLPGLPYGMAPYGGYGFGFGFNPIGPILGMLFFGALILLLLGFFSRPLRHQSGSFGPWQPERSDWGPGGWEERMKAWHEAHQQEKGSKNPEAEKEPGEAPPK